MSSLNTQYLHSSRLNTFPKRHPECNLNTATSLATVSKRRPQQTNHPCHSVQQILPQFLTVFNSPATVFNSVASLATVFNSPASLATVFNSFQICDLNIEQYLNPTSLQLQHLKISIFTTLSLSLWNHPWLALWQREDLDAEYQPTNQGFKNQSAPTGISLFDFSKTKIRSYSRENKLIKICLKIGRADQSCILFWVDRSRQTLIGLVFRISYFIFSFSC